MTALFVVRDSYRPATRSAAVSQRTGRRRVMETVASREGLVKQGIWSALDVRRRVAGGQRLC